MERRLVVLESRADVEKAVADALLDVIRDATFARGRADVVVTGGTVGIGSLAAVARNARSATTPWHLVHLWWGDERFVPLGDVDRNEGQAAVALTNHIDIPRENVHPFPADTGQGLPHALAEFRAHVRETLGSTPRFDVVLNGIGPDGHVASLFPHRNHGDYDELVIAVSDSPKPPPLRLSFTFRALNGGRHVWIVAAGEDKADAVARLMNDSPTSETPASGLHGVDDTVVWVDRAAASALA